MTLPLAILFALLLAACNAAGPAATGTPRPLPTAATPTPTTAASPATPGTTPTVTSPAEETPELPDIGDAVPEDVLREIMQETANATGVNLGELKVQRADAVTWSDSSLGCPEPGMVYLQVLTEGYWVQIEAGGQTYDFHASENGDWKLCPEGRGKPPVDDAATDDGSIDEEY